MGSEITLSKPDLGGREEELVLEVVRSGRLSLGPMLERFEREFAEWLGVEDAIATSSGTTALHLGVRSVGWGHGDRVVLSPFTFVASANALLYEGVEPVFADVDPVTLNLTPEGATAVVDGTITGVLPIDIFGFPCDMEGFERLAGQAGLGLLEDGAQALGTIDRQGRKVGSRGTPTAFAFYANKQMTTGEGGMLIPRDREEGERIRSERNQGRSADMSSLDHSGLGFNYRMSDVAAAIGVAQVERLDQLLAARERVATLYSALLEGDERLTLPVFGSGSEVRSWFVYVVRLAEGIDRDGVIERLAGLGIPSKAYLPCVHTFPQFAEFGYAEGDFPVAEAASRQALALPFHGSLDEAQVETVVASLREALDA
jgi:perosamine synthetase